MAYRDTANRVSESYVMTIESKEDPTFKALKEIVKESNNISNKKMRIDLKGNDVYVSTYG